MSYESAEWLKLAEKEWVFSGWYVDNTLSINLADYFSPYLRNARLDWQSIKIRPWHQILATLTAGSYPKGIGSYLRVDPANDRLVVRHNQDTTEKLVTIQEDGTVLGIDTSTNIASDNRMFFQNVADVVYCMNGSDWFGKLSWTTYTVPSTGVSNFAPSFSVVFNSSHWASGWSANPNKVYKSVADNYEDFNSSGSDTFTFSETITGLTASSQALFYFTKNTISVTWPNDIQDTAWTITYTTRTLQTTEGATNNACIVEVGSNVYYLSSSNAINMIAQGANLYGYEVMDLSERAYSGISKLMQSLDKDQSSAFGYLLPWEMLIKWFFRSVGSTFNDVCVIYDITKDKFLVDGQKYFYDWVFFKWNNYTVSMIEPKVYQDEYSQDDEWSPIPFEYRTKEYYVSESTMKKILRESRLLLDINELASLTQTIWMDGALVDTKTLEWSDVFPSGWWGIGTNEIWSYAIGTEWPEESIWEDDDYVETYILRTKWNLNKIGRKIQRRYTCWSMAGKVRLKDLTAKVEIKPALATNLTP
jgi:hypothetical protein